jgi:secreted PhoX family phosphatase
MSKLHDQTFLDPAAADEQEKPAAVGRRQFLAGSAAAAAATALAPAAFAQSQNREYGPGAPPIHYVDPDIIVVDDRFAKY